MSVDDMPHQVSSTSPTGDTDATHCTGPETGVSDWYNPGYFSSPPTTKTGKCRRVSWVKTSKTKQKGLGSGSRPKCTSAARATRALAAVCGKEPRVLVSD